MDGLAGCLWGSCGSPDPHSLPALFPARPPWRSAHVFPSPSWTEDSAGYGEGLPQSCFTCVVCHRGLDGIPFTVDATGQIHCIEDFRVKRSPQLLSQHVWADLSHLPHDSFLLQYPASPVWQPWLCLFPTKIPNPTYLWSLPSSASSPSLGSISPSNPQSDQAASWVPFTPQEVCIRCSMWWGHHA